ncbi:SRPBCC family protein [Asanoa sp. WMMD1127]|uniref:SRPBCC family protein n=1 Tax=Asanoa sp. WMMD1127 TaxID=3016107 RepID=UPI002416F1CC|nr:SRPBCC family protein [Asanoa sp. WMMD1127]MDG4827388.1 SRPBCC family protein [Asanoa sp. WMMD1127]
MAKSGTFTYSFEARCEPEVAVALLSDFSRHTELHPFIVKVTERPPVDGAVRSFVINDRFPLGPFHFTTTYTADVLAINRPGPSAGPAEIITLARQRPGTTLRNNTRIHPMSGGGIRADVTITLTAPTPLYAYAFKQAQAAHHALAERLPRVLEKQA